MNFLCSANVFFAMIPGPLSGAYASNFGLPGKPNWISHVLLTPFRTVPAHAHRNLENSMSL